MKLFQYLALVCIILFGVGSDTIEKKRSIYPQKLIFIPIHDRGIRACSMDPFNCEKFDLDPDQYTSLNQLVSYNNMIYSFAGDKLNVLIFDIFGKNVTVQPRIGVRDASEPKTHRPVTAARNGYIYTAIKSKLYECSMHKLEVCRVVMEDEKFRHLGAMKFHMEYIYMVFSEKIERCSNFNECHTVSFPKDSGTSGIAVATAGEYLYLDSTKKAHILRCKTDSMECNEMSTNIKVNDAQHIFGFYAINKSLYVVVITSVFIDYTIWKCNLTDLNSCEQLQQTQLDNTNIIISYSSVEMLSEYREEDKRCSWQSADNTHLKLSVSRDGKLIDVKGLLFDTSNASYVQFGTSAINETRAAIFVMDNGGSIFASNYHEPYKYHHSRLMAGKPVSSAGFLQVSNGVIKFVNSCSNHYKVPAEIAEQLLDSLYIHGYNSSVVDMVHNCAYETCTRSSNGQSICSNGKNIDT